MKREEIEAIIGQYPLRDVREIVLAVCIRVHDVALEARDKEIRRLLELDKISAKAHNQNLLEMGDMRTTIAELKDLIKSQGREKTMASPILKYFEFAHLPERLQPVSQTICELAEHMDEILPDCAEKTAGLRKLLEAKDCFVRTLL